MLTEKKTHFQKRDFLPSVKDHTFRHPSLSDKYLGSSEYVGIPRDTSQKPLKATEATATGTKNASGKKRIKMSQSSISSPAAVVVQLAGSLFQPLKEQPG